ncbi:hypothetical protein VULLAG_LOCUS4620 [Vulpes lagopus]
MPEQGVCWQPESGDRVCPGNSKSPAVISGSEHGARSHIFQLLGQLAVASLLGSCQRGRDWEGFLLPLLLVGWGLAEGQWCLSSLPAGGTGGRRWRAHTGL